MGYVQGQVNIYTDATIDLNSLRAISELSADLLLNNLDSVLGKCPDCQKPIMRGVDFRALTGTSIQFRCEYCCEPRRAIVERSFRSELDKIAAYIRSRMVVETDE